MAIKFTDYKPPAFGVYNTDREWFCNINDADLILKTKDSEISLRGLAAKVDRQEREAKEKALGAVAVALTGAAAMVNKNPVISRRFRRG